ncbi:MAG TPA: twin-arginine translocation signal domain-containing protein, partial [Tepidisphaeraceae bacterium]|nr:twin-arginine translocation signal domain-containing protein [Tepidisphaeraceae bacterium]
MPTTKTTRRQFLSDVGCGVLVGAVGATMATELGLSKALGAEPSAQSLSFGALESLVTLMQETPANKLLPALTEKLNGGTELRTLVAAAALANARTFGGEDYVGFHTLMAIAPAWHMSRELPSQQQALPVFKVLYRNTNRIQEHGGRKSEVLHPVQAA